MNDLFIKCMILVWPGLVLLRAKKHVEGFSIFVYEIFSSFPIGAFSMHFLSSGWVSLPRACMNAFFLLCQFTREYTGCAGRRDYRL